MRTICDEASYRLWVGQRFSAAISHGRNLAASAAEVISTIASATVCSVIWKTGVYRGWSTVYFVTVYPSAAPRKTSDGKWEAVVTREKLITVAKPYARNGTQRWLR